jgi:hypothetical protein
MEPNGSSAVFPRSKRATPIALTDLKEPAMSARTASAHTAVRVLASLGVAATALALHAAPAAGAPRVTDGTAARAVLAAPVPDAMTLVEKMSRRDDVYLNNPVDEGPDAVVRGGLCVRLEEVGCRQMVATKDASVMVFATARKAHDYAGHADDTATAYGRMVLSFGSPARVGVEEQPAYAKALRTFRRTHPEQKNDAARAVRFLARKGLLMRDPHVADRRGERPGRASEIPGAVDMVATDQADVIVFANRAAAKEYVSHADDQASRVGRVVLSFGNPPRVVPQSQPRYVSVLRNVLR